jgi:hypothetical protein
MSDPDTAPWSADEQKQARAFKDELDEIVHRAFALFRASHMCAQSLLIACTGSPWRISNVGTSMSCGPTS